MKKDILRYFIDYCKEDNSLIAEPFDRILDKGIVLTNENGEFEAPEKNVYVFSGVETYLKFAEAVGSLDEASENIAINVASSVETYLKFAEAVGQTVGQSENTLNIRVSGNILEYNYENNTEFLSTWLNVMDWSNIAENLEEKFQIFERILDKGIVELGYLQLKNYSDIYEDAETFERILDKGIVISYREENNNILISSVETYLKYAEALGDTGNVAVPA